ASAGKPEAILTFRLHTDADRLWSLLRPPPTSTRFPYTTLFRSTKPILTETEFAERKERLRNLVLQKKRAQARSHFIRSTADALEDRKSTRLNSSHVKISYAVFCLKKKMLNE